MITYTPSDDSFFLAEFLKRYLSRLKNKNINYLDMGTGSGILAETASEFLNKKNILTADINSVSVKLLKQKNFKSIKSNLFSKIKDKFDLITFNAPYLPFNKNEPKESIIATTGGKKGDELSLKFLKQAKPHLNKNGKIFLLISNLTPKDKINKFKPKIIARKKLFWEELLILEFS